MTVLTFSKEDVIILINRNYLMKSLLLYSSKTGSNKSIKLHDKIVKKLSSKFDITSHYCHSLSELENEITNFLYKTSKDFDSDICGFSQKLMKNYWTTDEWNKVHWNDIYKTSSFKVLVNSNLSSNYNMTKK